MARPREFDRQEVLDRAMQLFWEKGIEATSIQNLVECMGIGRASMYDTFGSKEQLIFEAMDYMVSRYVLEGIEYSARIEKRKLERCRAIGLIHREFRRRRSSPQCHQPWGGREFRASVDRRTVTLGDPRGSPSTSGQQHRCRGTK